jgi:peptide/nickel transport system substrate-binding protein
VVRRPPLSFALVLVLLLAAACSSSKSSPAASKTPGSTTLKLAYLDDMSVPDPDVFYDIEGNAVILSTYEGLLRYAPDTTTYEPVLASSWDVAPDGLSYTFHLRSGATFHDGTPVDSAAARASFQRRVDVASAPAYMLDAVDQMQTPDPTTFVVTLKHPVAPFLDYLASSWGPKLMSPKQLADHAGDDHAQTWLKTHDIGSGPFTLAGFERGQRYTLQRFDRYWGTKPYFATVQIDIVPDMNTQRLRLEKGDLDVILHSFPVSEIGGLQKNSSLSVQTFTSFLQSYLYLNSNKPPFDKPAVRKAVAQALDLENITGQVYAAYGAKAGTMYPGTLLAAGQAPFSVSFDAAAAKDAVKAAGNPKIDFAFTADESGLQRRLSEIVQQRLQDAGFQVSVRQVELPVVYDWATKPADGADLLLMTNTPDAAHPDTWARIVWGSKGGLNFLGYDNPDVDQILDQAIVTTDKAQADTLYAQVGSKVADDVAFIPIANVKDVMILRSDLDGVAHIPNYPWTLDLAKLRRKGG